MVPDLDLQLQVVIKALADVVMPALGGEQKMAAEQLGLSIATLNMVRARLPYDGLRADAALSHAIALARSLADSALDAEIEVAAATLERRDLTPAARDAATARLNAQISAIAANPSTPDAQLRSIVAGSQPSLDLARAWSLPGGFEPHPDTVPTLESLLGPGR